MFLFLVCRLFAEDFISYLKEHGVLKNDSDTAVYSYEYVSSVKRNENTIFV